jgi:1-acyl-sn-glycerol-3-phosphate acyltransferase
MQKIVIAKPYRFVPPRHGNFWSQLLLPALPFYLRQSHGVESVTCRGADRLRASLAAGHGIILAANHTRPCDPFVVGLLAGQADCLLYIMASWHVFMQNRFYAWLLPRLGVFSIYREGLDREGLKYAIRLLTAARRPLLLFPEGVLSRHNDRLNHLMEGTAIMARAAARQRAALTPPGRTVIHPVAIRYVFEGDIEAAVTPVLADLEARLAWRPHRELPLIERVLKVGSAMLALKEIEYCGEAQGGQIVARVQQLIESILRPLEEEWLKERQSGDVVHRVNALRKAILPDMTGDALPPPEQERREKHLADIYLAQQLYNYPAGYFTPAPTPERILETVERFEEDTTDIARIHRPLRAIVDVGEAIDVAPEGEFGSEGDPLMGEIRSQLHALLGASLAETHPGAEML